MPCALVFIDTRADSEVPGTYPGNATPLVVIPLALTSKSLKSKYPLGQYSPEPTGFVSSVLSHVCQCVSNMPERVISIFSSAASSKVKSAFTATLLTNKPSSKFRAIGSV